MRLSSWVKARLPADGQKREKVKLAAAVGLIAAAVGMGALAVRSSRPAEIPQVFIALSVGDGAAVRAAVEAEPGVVSATDPEGNTPLHIAAASGWVEVVGALLEAGADPNAINAAGWTPLFAAIEAPRRGQATVVSQLLAAGASPDVVLGDGQTVLHVAANTPTTDPKVVPLLARDPALARRTDRAGRTPLQLAQAASFKPIEQVLRRLQQAGGATAGATAAASN